VWGKNFEATVVRGLGQDSAAYWLT
jgi:hypothetical protein